MTTGTLHPGCPLCEGLGGHLVWQNKLLRVVRANEFGFPAFYRVVWQPHVPEFSDLSAADQTQLMVTVSTVERCLRDELAPTKVNLASLGNLVPHLHWHVVARFAWDSHHPSPVWAGALRSPDSALLAEIESKMAGVDRYITQRLTANESEKSHSRP